MIVGQLGGGLGTRPLTTRSSRSQQRPSGHHLAHRGRSGQHDHAACAGRPRAIVRDGSAAGSNHLAHLAKPRPGTYLIESGTHPSIQGPMGLYGILVVTAPHASGAAAGTAYPGVSYNAEVPLLLSEIDPVQNNAVSTAVGNGRLQRDHGVVRPARRLRQSSLVDVPDLLSAGGELHAAVLPDQRRGVR